MSYYRGLQYEREKKKVTNSGGKNQHTELSVQNDHQAKTAEKLARQHKVAAPTIRRDAQFARAVDTVAKAAGNGAKAAMLSRDTKVTKQDAVKLGEIAESNPQTVRNASKLAYQRRSHPLTLACVEPCA